MSSIPTGASVLIAITGIVDAGGLPTSFKVPPTAADWKSSDPTILPLTVAPDGLSATGTSLKAGTVTISTTGDGVTESVQVSFGAGVVAKFTLTVTVLNAPPPPPTPTP